jgi:hypothetical protein
MTVTYSETPQGTPEWLAERAGLLTASVFKDALSKGVTRQKLMDKLAFQRRTGIVEAGFKSPAMERGNLLEPAARAYAELMLDMEFAEVGLAINSDLPGLGASLDGLCGDIGLECKCPSGGVHEKYLRENRLPPEYAKQIHGQQLICGLRGTWFLSFYPEDDEQLLIYIPRDEDAIADLRDGLQAFVAELDKQTR